MELLEKVLSVNVVRKTCKNKAGIFTFNLNKNTNIYNIYMVLKNRKYKPLPFRLFFNI